MSKKTMAKAKPAKQVNRLTTVTSFSRLFAACLFVTVPILMFFVGMSYEFNIEQGLLEINQNAQPRLALVHKQTPKPPADWVSYSNAKYGFELKYPPTVKPTTSTVAQTFMYHMKNTMIDLTLAVKPVPTGTMPEKAAAKPTWKKGTGTPTTYESMTEKYVYTFTVDKEDASNSAAMIMSSFAYPEPTGTMTK